MYIAFIGTLRIHEKPGQRAAVNLSSNLHSLPYKDFSSLEPVTLLLTTCGIQGRSVNHAASQSALFMTVK